MPIVNLSSLLLAIAKSLLPSVVSFISRRMAFCLSIFFACIFFSSVILIYQILEAKENTNNKFTNFDSIVQQNTLVEQLAKKCGNGTSVMLSVISTNTSTDIVKNEFRQGKIQAAFAVDEGEVENLAIHNPQLYSPQKTFLIEIPTYNLFKSFANKVEIIELKQSTTQQTSSHFINAFLDKTDWGKESKLKRTYITSIVKDISLTDDSQLIYVISIVVSNDYDYNKSICVDIPTEIEKLKNQINSL